jgi:AcrR family transcriptional regulator
MAGRPRAFDRETALLTAMEQFWRDGYEETTVATLTKAMGISPPSLYAAFGDKDQLFHDAASCYFNLIAAQLDRALDQATARQGIAELLRVTAAAHTDSATPPGCFMLTEPRLAERRKVLRERIAARLERGLSEGDVPPGTDPDQVASFVMAVLGGMSARARDGGSAAEVAGIAALALAALPRSVPS